MKTIKYLIFPIVTVFAVIMIYNSIPLFLKIKGEEFLYSNNSEIKEILVTSTSRKLYNDKEGTLRFIGYSHSLTNPEYPELEIIYPAEEKIKVITGNKPSLVIVYKCSYTKYLFPPNYAGESSFIPGDYFVPCKNVSSNFNLNFPKIFLIDSKKFNDYIPIVQFFIRLKTNIYSSFQRLKYSCFETYNARWILSDEDLTDAYKRYLFHSLKMPNPYY